MVVKKFLSLCFPLNFYIHYGSSKALFPTIPMEQTCFTVVASEGTFVRCIKKICRKPPSALENMYPHVFDEGMLKS